MDGITGLIFIVAFAVAWQRAKAEQELAKKGITPPRMVAKYGPADAAAKVAKYGFLDHLRDVWRDYWPRRTDAVIAARDAKATQRGQRLGWRERWRGRIAAAKSVFAGDGSGHQPKHARRGGQQSEPSDPAAAVEEKPQTAPGPQTAPPAPEQTQPTTTGPSTGGTVTAPTGEAVNYETTINELEKLANEQRAHIDHCQEALRAVQAARAAINNMQESYRASSAAAGSTHEHLAAKNLDGTTLANAGTTADAMPAGAVDQMYDALEEMEEQAKQRLNDAEVALGATEANLAHIQSTYGDAHDTVAQNLSGDASFLDSGGTASPGGGAAQTGATGGGTARNGTNGAGGAHNIGVINRGSGDVTVSNVAVGAGAKVNNGGGGYNPVEAAEQQAARAAVADSQRPWGQPGRYWDPAKSDTDRL